MRLAAARLRATVAGLHRAGGSMRPWSISGFAWRAPIVQFIADRSGRERVLLGLLAVVALFAAIERLVWHPLEVARRTALSDIARDDRISARLRAAGPDVARIAAARTGTLAGLITDRAAKSGLTIQRIEPQGATVTVTLDDAGFDAMIDWLAALERDAGVRVVDLKVDRRPDPGVVTAQVTLTE